MSLTPTWNPDGPSIMKKSVEERNAVFQDLEAIKASIREFYFYDPFATRVLRLADMDDWTPDHVMAVLALTSLIRVNEMIEVMSNFHATQLTPHQLIVPGWERPEEVLKGLAEWFREHGEAGNAAAVDRYGRDKGYVRAGDPQL